MSNDNEIYFVGRLCRIYEAWKTLVYRKRSEKVTVFIGVIYCILITKNYSNFCNHLYLNLSSRRGLVGSVIRP